ncbi:MAG TPA: hypothetical protein VFD58_27170 [Blastocatellia bacterium]|nr:hypothetical protein [Blastocatellia bacterium]
MTARRAFRIRGLRWWVAGLVFLATLINYIDRQTVSVLAPIIRRDLGLSNLEYASIGTWFLFAYSMSMFVFGKVSYRPILIASGLLVPLGTTILFLLAGTVRRVSPVR